MYGAGFSSYVDMGGLTDTLCGRSRPGHFRGVCTVVMKLFNIVKPDRAYFGWKDAQQLAVVRKMVRDLDMDIEIVACETVREGDGLAKSSRNVYLDRAERVAAAVLPAALRSAGEMVRAGVRRSAELERVIREEIAAESLARLDYAEVVDLETLAPVDTIEAPALVAAAVYIGRTRLIDNFVV
jgi:pantoate--beta-alanine ligase